MNKLNWVMAGLLLAGFAQAQTQTPTQTRTAPQAQAQAAMALTSRSTELHAQPQSDSASIATLDVNTRLEVLSRKGAWSEVRTAAGQVGWVRMMGLSAEAGAAPAASGNPLAGLGSLLSSGRNDNAATVTTGVRGLSAEDVQNAQANPAELQQMQKFAADRNTANAFGKRARLAPATLDYLPAPASSPAMQPGSTDLNQVGG
jgi:hypothetical protein